MGGGYRDQQQRTEHDAARFNEAAARGRRIRNVRRIDVLRTRGFNEAAARGRRILLDAYPDAVPAVVASMRPPPVGGGYYERPSAEVCVPSCFNEAAARGRRIRGPSTSRPATTAEASMRPPPVGGGYALLPVLFNCSFSGFNEAAARGRRIPKMIEDCVLPKEMLQ